MAKFLKFIANLLLVLMILIGLAILIPPVAGVTTVVRDEQIESNMPVGSITYAWRTSIADLQPGNKILDMNADTVNVYEVADVDPMNSTVTGLKVGGDKAEELIRPKTAQKVIVTIPLIGYVSIALQSMEGRIILGLAAGLVVLLLIVSEVFIRKREAEREAEEAEAEEDSFYRDLAEKKLRADAEEEQQFRERQAERAATAVLPSPEELREEGNAETSGAEVPEGEAPLNPEEAAEAAAEAAALSQELANVEDASGEEDKGETKVIPPLVVETEEEEPGEEKQTGKDKKSSAEPDKQEKKEKTEKTEETAGPSDLDVKAQDFAESEESVSAAPVDEAAMDTGGIPNVQAALEAALTTTQIQRQSDSTQRIEVPQEEELAQVQNLDEIELAIPAFTLEELLQQAYSVGDDPIVEKDAITGVTFVDYSDCL